MLQYIRRLANWLKGTRFSKTRVGSFIVDVLIELLGVTWPSKEDIKSSTAVVMVTMLLVSAFLGAVGFVLFYVVHEIQIFFQRG